MAGERRFEVRITYCCCCGLTIATILIAIYCLIFYGVSIALASWALDKIYAGQPYYYYTLGEQEYKTGNIILINPYYDSLGQYFQETKFISNSDVQDYATGHKGYFYTVREAVLWIDIAVYILVILTTVLLFVALCTTIYWLLLPWMVAMILDIIRGIISCILIFVYCGDDIRKIAVGIFFLGLQLFHISLIIIIFAKFQRMQNRKRAHDLKVIEKPGQPPLFVEGSTGYPTLPSQYAYSMSPHFSRGKYYQPDYSTAGAYPAERSMSPPRPRVHEYNPDEAQRSHPNQTRR